MDRENDKVSNNDNKAVLNEPLLPNEYDSKEQLEEELAKEEAKINKKVRIRIIAAVVTLIIGCIVFYFTVIRDQAKPSSPSQGITGGEIK